MRSLTSQLLPLYDEHEARSIVRLLLAEVFGFKLADICAGALDNLNDDQRQLLAQLMARLEKGEPIQYVVGWTFFCNRKFIVRRGCLIPRPETEELCQWITRENKDRQVEILDIGTGSGCIAVTLNMEMPAAKVTAWDISADALNIARENIATNKADVRLEQQDALNPPRDIERWDMIVSNPPYICHKEAVDMERNVLDYEPRQALFVPDEDPLLFFRSISKYATHALKDGGRLYFEINPIYTTMLTDLLANDNFQGITVEKDAEGRERMVKANKGRWLHQ